jgi:hypothetical protein
MFVARLAQDVKDLVEIPSDGQAFPKTLEAMKAGRQVIY